MTLTDFGIDPPAVADFMTVDERAMVEFALELGRQD